MTRIDIAAAEAAGAEWGRKQAAENGPFFSTRRPEDWRNAVAGQCAAMPPEAAAAFRAGALSTILG